MRDRNTHLEANALFEETTARASQLTAFTIIIHDSLDADSIDIKALQDTIWLLADLLRNQHKDIVKLQEIYANEVPAY